jgi:cobalt-zinc-cadmium efflux system membrane fusion protein
MKGRAILLFILAIVGSMALGAWGMRHFDKWQALTMSAKKEGEALTQKSPATFSHRENPKEHGPHETHDHDKHGHEEEHEHEEHEHGEENVVHLTEAKRKELGIEVAVAKAGRLQTRFNLSGTIAFNTDRLVHIVPRIPGVVREVRKNLGDSVRAGEVMAVIDSRELADAKAAYLAATERVTLAEDMFQREKDLWEKKISPAQDYLTAKKALAEARIELRVAQQKLQALGVSDASLKQLSGAATSLTRYDIVSPLMGSVIEKHVTVGELLKEDTEAFSVADFSTVWVDLYVAPPDLPLVQKGQKVVISTGTGVPEAEGEISYIGPMAVEKNRAVLTRVVLPNPEGRFRPGLFVTATLAAGEAAVAVLIPHSAVQTIAGKPCVFVQTHEGFERRPVTLGQSNDTHVEVTAGLKAGERYAATETFLLKADLAKGGAEHAH